MQLHHVAITVKDLNESVQFYQDLFGFKQVQSFERRDLNGKAVFIEMNGFKIELWEFAQSVENKDNLGDIKVRGLRHIAFEVKDLDTVLFELKQKGAKTTEPQLGASGHRYSFLSDPNGIALDMDLRGCGVCLGWWDLKAWQWFGQILIKTAASAFKTSAVCYQF